MIGALMRCSETKEVIVQVILILVEKIAWVIQEVKHLKVLIGLCEQVKVILRV